MKGFTGQSDLQQVDEQARVIWQKFNEKMCSLTVTTTQPRNDRIPKNGALPLSEQQKQAGTRIANWWRRIRNSGQTIPLNQNGAHPPEFHTLLNNQLIQKRLSYEKDKQLLQELTTSPWQSECFRDENMQQSALNLFAAGKITWQQKATFSLINETKQCYGEFKAIPVLDDQGQDFSADALKYLAPFLKHTPFYYEEPSFDPKDGYLTDGELMLFLALVRQLPKSEQFIFLFKEQHRNNKNQGHPSPDTLLRAVHSRYIEREVENYNGILLLSHGIRNAIGLAHYSVKNWTPVIPRLGAQTIEDVEFFIKKGARIAVSGDSRILGLVDKMMNVHGLPMMYPDNFMHDEYHSLVASRLGANALQGIDRIIELARSRFGKRWSKDLWLLRDADFSNTGYQEDMETSEAVTERFAGGLTTNYHVQGYLDDCDDVVKKTMDGKPFLFGTDDYPNQIFLNFVIDFVRNPDEWKKFNISIDYCRNYKVLPILIRMARFLNEQGIFEEDHGDNQQHKLNIIRFDCFMRSYAPPFTGNGQHREWNDWTAPKVTPKNIMEQMRLIATESDHYNFKSRNKSLLFGFVKEPISIQKAQTKKRERVSELSAINPTHETQLREMFIVACSADNLTDIEHFLDNHRDLLDTNLFEQALEHVKTVEAAELLFTKSGLNKFPKNDKGEPVLPSNTAKVETKREREYTDNDEFSEQDEYLRQENRLLQEQVESLQNLANLRLAKTLELEEKLKNKEKPKRKKNK